MASPLITQEPSSEEPLVPDDPFDGSYGGGQPRLLQHEDESTRAQLQQLLDHSWITQARKKLCRIDASYAHFGQGVTKLCEVEV